ncbi:hypothetical protein GN956_G23834 [Arapaima gigas]
MLVSKYFIIENSGNCKQLWVQQSRNDGKSRCSLKLRDTIGPRENLTRNLVQPALKPRPFENLLCTTSRGLYTFLKMRPAK